MILQQKVDELKAYIDKWADEVRKELKLPSTGHSIGVSFEPNVILTHVPGEEPSVAPGFYRSRSGHLSNVEVLGGIASPNVFFHTTSEDGASLLESMSPRMFNVLYERYDPA